MNTDYDQAKPVFKQYSRENVRIYFEDLFRFIIHNYKAPHLFFLSVEKTVTETIWLFDATSSRKQGRIIHEDLGYCYLEAREFAKKLTDAGYPCEFHVLHDRD